MVGSEAVSGANLLQNKQYHFMTDKAKCKGATITNNHEIWL